MKTVNKLYLSFTKHFNNKEISVTVRLSDDCKNGFNEFSICGDVYLIHKDGRKEWFQGGCIHDLILKHFKGLKPFVDLHLSDVNGTPMYAVENGIYYIQENRKDALMSCLRICEAEADYLFDFTDPEDKGHFKYLLNTLRLPQRWKEEASNAIKILEEKNNVKFEDNSTKLRDVKMSDEEMAHFKRLEDVGYYSLSSIQQRIKEREDAKKAAQRQELIDGYNKDVEKFKRILMVKLYVLDQGLLDNFIYYDHTNKGVFNWKDYGKKVTQKEFAEFMRKVDYSQLPEGINFEMKQ